MYTFRPWYCRVFRRCFNCHYKTCWLYWGLSVQWTLNLVKLFYVRDWAKVMEQKCLLYLRDHVSNFLFCFLKSDRIFSPNWPMGLLEKMLVLLAFLLHERQSDTLPNKHSFAAIRNFLFVPFSFSCSFRLGPCPCPFFRERQFERKTTTKIPFSILLLLLLSLLTAEKEAEKQFTRQFWGFGMSKKDLDLLSYEMIIRAICMP